VIPRMGTGEFSWKVARPSTYAESGQALCASAFFDNWFLGKALQVRSISDAEINCDFY